MPCHDQESWSALEVTAWIGRGGERQERERREREPSHKTETKTTCVRTVYPVKNFQLAIRYLLELMEGQAEEEDDEEMVRVPEHLKVGATDELEGGGDHQKQGHSDDMTCDTSSCHKTNGDGI